MKPEYVPFAVGSRVVVGDYISPSFEITENNVGTIYKVVQNEKCVYTYSILLDNNKEIEEVIETKYYGYYIESAKLTFIDEVLNNNKRYLEDCINRLEVLKANEEYLSKTKLNNSHILKEYKLKIKEKSKQVEQKYEEKEKKFKIWAIKLRNEIFSCDDKKAAKELLDRRHYNSEKLERILEALSISTDECECRAELVETLIDSIFEKKKNN